MSTRSIILVTGPGAFRQSDTTVRLYKHSDGYPSGNLPIISAAIKSAKAYNAAKAKSYNEPKDARPLVAEQVAGKIIGEASTCYGMGAQLEETFEGVLKLEHAGNQWDVEYVYVVDLNKATVSVFGGSFTKGIQHGVKLGTIDINTEVDRYIPEAQDGTRKRLAKAVKAFKACGFELAKPGLKPFKGKIKQGKQTCKIDLLITRGAK